MRAYETLLVLSNDPAASREALVKRFEDIVRQTGGTVDASREWGSRRMAYTVGKQAEGYYHLLEYHAEPATVSELERNLRITDGVLRYLSVQQEHTGLPQPRSKEPSARDDVPLHELRGRRPRGSWQGAREGDAGEESREQRDADMGPGGGDDAADDAADKQSE